MSYVVSRCVWFVCGAVILSGCASLQPAAPPASLPLVVAHRGGAADAPENTLAAIREAIDHGADAIWLSVQLSKDDVPVLYRPADLSALTDATGPVAARTAQALSRINAGWAFESPTRSRVFPYRDRPAGIPTLRQALQAVPADMPLILDMKAMPALPQARAVARVLDEEEAWARVLIYSTEADYQQAFAAYPQARMFESRDRTRTRLLTARLGGGCTDAPTDSSWAAFEMRRKMKVVETFTLGEGRSDVVAELWSAESVGCFRQQSEAMRLMAIAVNDAADYQTAACLGLDAVLADSPRDMAAVRARLTRARPMPCAPMPVSSKP